MEIQEVDGKKFETNGIWKYKNRGIPVGQIGYNIKGSIWKGAAIEDGEEEFIFDIPRIVGEGNVINLGDLNGGSAILLAQGFQQKNIRGHVYTVDNYGPIQMADSHKNMVRLGVDGLITIINKRTDEAISTFRGTYTFVFIDAEHSYKGVRSDWLNYSPLIKDGGLIAFHDTNQTEINRVLEDHVIKDWKLEYWVNRIKAFSRR